MDLVQIDHTPVDVIVVDRENRQPIGRPWLTHEDRIPATKFLAFGFGE